VFALFNKFAESTGPNIHSAPSAVFELGGATITNSILYGWISAVIIVSFMLWVSRKVTLKPKGGVVQLIEVGVDFITNLVVNAFDDKKIGRKYVPFFVTMFFVILFYNWLLLVRASSREKTHFCVHLRETLTQLWLSVL
jgi:F0F1-type ATP synthase membrane subunit a